MGDYTDYTCLDCGNKWKFTSYFLLYRKDNKIVENIPLMLTSDDFYESDLKGMINLTFCENCNKKVKIYSVPENLDEKNKQKYIEEIKEYMKHKRPKFTIKKFMEDFDPNNIICPICDKKLPLDYLYKKCPKCNSKNIIGVMTLAD